MLQICCAMHRVANSCQALAHYQRVDLFVGLVLSIYGMHMYSRGHGWVRVPSGLLRYIKWTHGQTLKLQPQN